jgi:recombination protein RecA
METGKLKSAPSAANGQAGGTGRDAQAKGRGAKAVADRDREKDNGKPAERDSAKGAALKAALTQIERQFGQGSLMRLGDDAAAVAVAVIPTGALSVDLALGVGGVPRGRIVEIFGPESSGKTTLVYEIIAQAQKTGGVCAFIDAEHAIDPAYARRIGVDIDELLVSQPDHGEQALEIADVLIRSGAVDVVAIDSVAALTPKAELEGQMGDQQVGLQARLMSQALRKLAGNLNRTNTVCIFTNQIREKIGVMFGSPETQPGGRALKFYASQRIDIRRIETLKEGTEAVGNRVRAKIVKNKVAAPFRQAEFDIEYGLGISAEGCVLDLGIEHNLVQKSGAFFSYDGERLGQGRNNAKQFLREHTDLMGEIEGKIYEALGLERVGKTVDPPEEAASDKDGEPPAPAPPEAQKQAA